MPNSSPKPKKVLIVALSGIGNYLMQMPAIKLLKETHPDWHIVAWVAPRGTRALAENDPSVDEVIEAPIKASLAGHVATLRQLRRRKFDIAVVMSPGQLVKSAAYLYLAGIPERVGNAYPFRGNPQSDFLLTDAVPEDENLHDIEQNLQLLSSLEIENWKLKIGAPYSLFIPESAQMEAQKIIASLTLNSAAPLVGLHAGSAPDFLWKRWPLENFAAVAKELIEKQNAHILLFGGPDEESQKEELQQLIKNDNVSIISAKLLTTAAIMQHCVYVISNDSGLMHLAAASGVKVYGLFGPTDEKKTGPRGSDSVVIRAHGTKPVYNTETSFSHGLTSHETMRALPPEMVLDKINSYTH